MRPHDTFFELQRLVVDLAFIERHHHLIDSERHENNIEHSFMVALLCWYICSRHALELDLSKVLRYALAHDFVERYAGDTNTFASKKERALKVEREKLAAKRLSDDFVDFQDLVKIINDYEAKNDEEALFVWTVDKMQALVLGELDGWRPYQKLEISYDQFADKYHELIASASPHCEEIFSTLVEYCKTTYYDQPG